MFLDEFQERFEIVQYHWSYPQELADDGSACFDVLPGISGSGPCRPELLPECVHSTVILYLQVDGACLGVAQSFFYLSGVCIGNR